MMQVHGVVKPVLTVRPLCGCHRSWTSQNEVGGYHGDFGCSTGVSYTMLFQISRPSRVARRGNCAKSPNLHRPRQGWPMRARAQAGSPPARWNLDDVERISRGRPSKAKTGSRAVPHRLNAEERKEFELAKKRGYVVDKEKGRRYPLVNTYRNYCDALGVPCIRIEQGSGVTLDQVVVDLSPLHLSNEDHVSLQEKLLTAIKEALAQDERTQRSFAAEDAGIEALEQDSESVMDELSAEDKEELVDPELVDRLSNEILPLRLEASRSEAKVVSQVVLDVWRRRSRLPESNQTDST